MSLTSGELRTSSTPHLAEFNTALASLERRGFAVRDGQAWRVAHDEYARVAIESCDEAQRQAARVALGLAIAQGAGDDVGELRRVGRLIAPGGQSALLTAMFERFVRAARRHRDARSDRELARDFFGEAGDAEAMRRAAAQLPLLVRLRLVTPTRMWQTAMALASLLALAALAMWRATQVPSRSDAVLVAIRPSTDPTVLEALEVHLPPESWSGGRSVNIDLSRRATLRMPSGGVGGRALKPDGAGWTVGIPVPDSGVIDLIDIALDGRATRITYAAGDDYQPSWAPDNSALVFVTSRWSTRGRYDLAILESGSYRVRQLTSGDDTDWEPAWSPDGSRIAFVRQYAGSGARGLCVVDADGSHLDCLAPDPASEPTLAGWLDAERVLLRRAAGATHQLVSFDLSARTTAIVDEQAAGAAISPDGRFAVCPCHREGYPAGTWIVYPLARPNDFAVLRPTSGDSSTISFAWSPTAPRPASIEALRIEVGNGPPQLRAAHQLRAVAEDSAGRPVVAGVIRWRSADTTIAAVDSAGLLRALRPGRLTVVASAGGWREVKREITISDTPTRVTFEEDWSTALDSNWRSFGIPRPRIVRHAILGSAFLSNGDASFFSGAYTRRDFPLHEGLWVDATISTPLSAAQWQSLVVSLFSIGSARARAAWSAWDHLSGDGPPGLATPRFSLRYPDGAGGDRIGHELRIGTISAGGLFAAPPGLRSGVPHRVVMQLFPDGRSGVAIDGAVVWVGPATFFEPAVHLMLAGNTVDTQMLVGRLRVGSGISEDMAAR